MYYIFVLQCSTSLNGHLMIPLLLLLLSRFSRVWLCTTPQMAAHQAPPSLGFSRQEQWSVLPFSSPMHESEKSKWSRSVVSDSLQPHGLQPTRLLHPQDSPGKNTGVGFHFFLQLSGVFSFIVVCLYCTSKYCVLLLFYNLKLYGNPVLSDDG